MTQPDGFYPPPRLKQPRQPPVVFAWSAQTPADEQLLLEDLDLWVLWLVDRFQLDTRTVPECWHQHPELIEELSALHLSWQGAFATTASHDAPLAWHERFAFARGRIGDWVARLGCRPDRHRAPRGSAARVGDT